MTSGLCTGSDEAGWRIIRLEWHLLNFALMIKMVRDAHYSQLSTPDTSLLMSTRNDYVII